MRCQVHCWSNQTGLKRASAIMLWINGSETLYFKISHHFFNQPVSTVNIDDPNQTAVQYKQAIHHCELEATFQQAQTQTHKLTHCHLHDSEEINTHSKFF